MFQICKTKSGLKIHNWVTTISLNKFYISTAFANRPFKFPVLKALLGFLLKMAKSININNKTRNIFSQSIKVVKNLYILNPQLFNVILRRSVFASNEILKSSI